MYVSIQTVCSCHGYLLFDSIYCDRCRSLIPYQLTDESLLDTPLANLPVFNEPVVKAELIKQGTNASLTHRKQLQEQSIASSRVRFRAICPFCNSPTYVVRYYCKRERIYYLLRIQNFGENQHSVYKSIAETQNMNSMEQLEITTNERSQTTLSGSVEDSYSLADSIPRKLPSTILYDQNGIPNAKDIQIENEKQLHALNDLQGDLFNILRNGLYYDTLIQCQDNVKIQAHRCILGGRSPWFRHLLNEHHDSSAQEDYILQISIDDMTSDVLDEVLNFMYTNRCLISLKNAPDLLLAAKRFELDKLRRQVGEFLLSRLTVDNAIDMLICAHESGSEALKLACIRIINRHAAKIKRTEKWRRFKAQYVDLVPELYEYRIERPERGPTVFLSDVFAAPIMPSKSLLTLSQLYDNPVQQPVESPIPRIAPPKKKTHETTLPPTTYHKTSPNTEYQLIPSSNAYQNSPANTSYQALPPPPAHHQSTTHSVYHTAPNPPHVQTTQHSYVSPQKTNKSSVFVTQTQETNPVPTTHQESPSKKSFKGTTRHYHMPQNHNHQHQPQQQRQHQPPPPPPQSQPQRNQYQPPPPPPPLPPQHQYQQHQQNSPPPPQQQQYQYQPPPAPPSHSQQYQYQLPPPQQEQTAPPANNLVRTVYTSVVQPPETDPYRPPVKPYGNLPMSADNKNHHTTNNQAVHKTASQLPTTVSRGVSPKSLYEIGRSPTITEGGLDDNLGSERGPSTETME